MSLPSDEDEDEDEETLQLKLKAIEAKLKLKKLQQAKAKKIMSADVEKDSFNEPTRTANKAETGSRSDQAVSGASVQVPLSPTKDRRAPLEQRSPARVMLGIDKGLKAQNVSLKRAASTSTQSGATSRTTNSLARSKSQRGMSAIRDPPPIVNTKSFSERLAEVRNGDREKQDKADRIQSVRSHGFGLNNGAVLSYNRGSKQTIQLQDGRPAWIASRYMPQTSSKSTTHTAQPRSANPEQEQSNMGSDSVAPTVSEPTSTLEPFSGLHLSKRLISHTALTRAFTSKALYTIPKLLKEVKGPHYEPPDVESDFVVLGIIASKSSPRDHVNGPKTTTTADADDDAKAAGRNKFMALRLTDLKWEVDLFLFGSAFSQFWKLTPGTLVAVLNPGIMPPKPGREATGAFALKLASSEDTVLEIGTARDLGFCESVKANGSECGSWVNAKKTEFCEFHVNLQVDKARAGRMEVNGMGRFGGKGGEGKKWTNSPYVSKDEQKRIGLLPAAGREFDYETRESYYMVPRRTGTSATKMLDKEEFGMNPYDRGRNSKELQRKRREDREKELDLADKLGKIGGKAGGEYMRLKQSGAVRGTATSNDIRSSASSGVLEKPDAASLGLLNKTAADVTLSPVKRKRGTGGGSSEPVGWGGAFKRGLLLSPKKPDTNSRTLDEGTESGTLSPTKKRARFLLDKKGLREPGRDSLGVAGNDTNNDDDDDDELDII